MRSRSTAVGGVSSPGSMHRYLRRGGKEVRLGTGKTLLGAFVAGERTEETRPQGLLRCWSGVNRVAVTPPTDALTARDVLHSLSPSPSLILSLSLSFSLSLSLSLGTCT
jgi:hypothetical protein